VTVPPRGSVTLLDAQGAPVTAVVLPGAGTYTLDPSTGQITFVPEPGFAGVPEPVRFEVVDAYGQATQATYQPVVEARLDHAPAPEAGPTGPAGAPPLVPDAAAPPCVSRRRQAFNWITPRGVRLRRQVLSVDGRAVARLGGGVRRASLDFRGRGPSLAVIRVRATTTTGRRLALSRTYYVCRPDRLPPRLKTLRLRPVKAGRR
jgi:CshA-type fibril repeat protein